MVENGIAAVTDASHQRDRVPHVAIVGGGITGLAAAYYLTKKSRDAGIPLNYTLLEASARLGGKIVSEEVDGFLVDGGPDCFLTRKPWALSLCRELGLESDLLGTNEARRRVYVLNGGRLHPLPEGVMLIVPTQFLPFATSRLISIPGKLRMAMDLFIPPRHEDGDETLASFVRRRLGDEALDKIAEPLLSGIHVSDPERLSLKSSFPRLMEVERKYGSLIRGMLAARRAMHQSSNGSHPRLPMFMALRGGMQQLVDGVAGRLAPASLRVNCPVEALRHTGGAESGYQVHLHDGEVLRADAVILATPADVSARLLRELDADLAADLARMRYVSTAVVSLGYRPQAGLPDLKGFGFIIPKSEERRISACTCEIMGLHAEPDVVCIYRWHKVNPQYDLGHLDWVAHMRKQTTQHNGLFLAGSSYDGVGVPDCVRQGQEAAESVLASVIQA
jgi:oxygen-dependent protoporphyrinogen oxidase